MIGAVIGGTLIRDPVERTTREGKPFATATMRVPAGADALFIGVTAFGETAAARLMQMRAGGTVAACGTLEQTTWTGKDGAERVGWRLTASEILSAYSATKRRRAAEGDGDA